MEDSICEEPSEPTIYETPRLSTRHQKQSEEEQSVSYTKTWSRSMLRRILSLSEDHGDDTDRRAKVYIIERIMDADPHAIPFSWEMVERELFHLKKGPDWDLWSGRAHAFQFRERLLFNSITIILTCGHGKSGFGYSGIDFWEAYRMVQWLKLERLLEFNWDGLKWMVW